MTLARARSRRARSCDRRGASSAVLPWFIYHVRAIDIRRLRAGRGRVRSVCGFTRCCRSVTDVSVAVPATSRRFRSQGRRAVPVAVVGRRWCTPPSRWWSVRRDTEPRHLLRLIPALRATPVLHRVPTRRLDPGENGVQGRPPGRCSSGPIMTTGVLLTRGRPCGAGRWVVVRSCARRSVRLLGPRCREKRAARISARLFRVDRYTSSVAFVLSGSWPSGRRLFAVGNRTVGARRCRLAHHCKVVNNDDLGRDRYRFRALVGAGVYEALDYFVSKPRSATRRTS